MGQHGDSAVYSQPGSTGSAQAVVEDLVMALRSTLSLLIAALLVAWAAHMTNLNTTVERYKETTNE
jgi:hypothetical protein